MDERQRRTLDQMLRVQEFCAAHPITSPPALYAGNITALGSSVKQLQAQAAEQDSGLASARSATKSRAALLRALREEHMIPLKKIANALSGDIAGIEQQFRVPGLQRNRETLLAAARAMLLHAPAYADIFIAHGCPEDFIARLQSAIDAVDTVTDTRITGLRRRGGGTSGLTVAINVAKKSVKILDVMVRRAFTNQIQILQEWLAAKKFFPPIRITRPVTGTPAVTGVDPERRVPPDDPTPTAPAAAGVTAPDAEASAETAPLPQAA